MHGRNNRLSRWGMQGVFATDDARAPRDVRGQTLPVRFEIVDKRPLPPAQGAVHGDTAQAQRRGPYSVAVSLQVRAVTYHLELPYHQLPLMPGAFWHGRGCLKHQSDAEFLCRSFSG